MKIATWNVNSLRVRLAQVLDWLGRERPDVLCLQETKTPDGEFPSAALEAAGYAAVFAGQRTYNGVAVVARGAIRDALRDLPGLDDPQRRFLAATAGGVRVVNVYVPNGEAVGTEKYAYKLDWLDRLAAFVRAELAAHPRLLVAGDLNIAPEPRDVHDPAAWEGRVLFSEPERQAFRHLVDAGLHDAFRLFEQAENQFSWWDYRAAAFRRNLGLRIDHILIGTELARACTGCRVDVEPRRNERPSDHAPVVAEFRDELLP